MKAIFTIIFVSALCQVIAAQDVATSTLVWSVSRMKDIDNGLEGDYTCTFETSPTQTILWKQRSGNYVTTLQITGRKGEWKDVRTNGSVSFQISVDGQTGNITFERNALGTWITLELTQANKSQVKNQFTVQKIN